MDVVFLQRIFLVPHTIDRRTYSSSLNHAKPWDVIQKRHSGAILKNHHFDFMTVHDSGRRHDDGGMVVMASGPLRSSVVLLLQLITIT
jgi:hypothetical protein